MGNQPMKPRNLWPTSCMPRVMRHGYDGQDMSRDEERNGSERTLPSVLCAHEADELENVVINNDVDRLQYLVKQNIDVNVPLNERGETALILAVKVSHVDIVNILLTSSKCNKNCLNINNCSALDIAMITAFDNRLEPRHTVCWDIIKSLLSSSSEPACKDAMMYVIRTALKYCDEDFIHKLINLAKEHSFSSKLHELLLQKLHRHQPIYIESLDPLLTNVSDFTTKLLKNANQTELPYIVNSMLYYLESYWSSKENKISVVKKLILYATGAGWLWLPQQLSFIERVNPNLAHWCAQQKCRPASLKHCTRNSLRQSFISIVSDGLVNLVIPSILRDYILLEDVEVLLNTMTNLNDIKF